MIVLALRFFSFNNIQENLSYTFEVPGWHTASDILAIMYILKYINLDRQNGVLVEKMAE